MRDPRLLHLPLPCRQDIGHALAAGGDPALLDVTLRTEFAGAIKGSRPVYGRYAPLQYPNWATKFYVDALLAKQRALDGDAYSVPVQLSAG